MQVTRQVKATSCALCGCASQLVDSHILPRSFYREFSRNNAKQDELVIVDGANPSRTTRLKKGGIFARFLCALCEAKFNTFDGDAHDILNKQSRKVSEVITERHAGWKVQVYRPKPGDVTKLHLFAASLLWRASTCGRNEYAAMKLGPYEQLAKHAVESGGLPPRLADAIGIWHIRFEGDQRGLDAIYQPLREYKFTSEGSQKFRAWSFDYPYGRLLIRVGRHFAKDGFIRYDDEKGGKCRAALWTCQISPQYPNWAVLVCPRTLLDNTFEKFVSTVWAHETGYLKNSAVA